MTGKESEAFGGSEPNDPEYVFAIHDIEPNSEGHPSIAITYGGLQLAIRDHGRRLTYNPKNGSNRVKSIFTVGIAKGFDGQPVNLAFPVTVEDSLDAPEIEAAVKAYDKYKDYITN